MRVFSSSYALYGDLSARLMDVLGRAPRVEIYCIDEAFLDLTGFEETALLEYAWGMVGTVRRWLGLPASVGIGPTKVLAKVANRIAKKRKTPGGVVTLLHPVGGGAGRVGRIAVRGGFRGGTRGSSRFSRNRRPTSRFISKLARYINQFSGSKI